MFVYLKAAVGIILIEHINFSCESKKQYLSSIYKPIKTIYLSINTNLVVYFNKQYILRYIVYFLFEKFISNFKYIVNKKVAII